MNELIGNERENEYIFFFAFFLWRIKFDWKKHRIELWLSKRKEIFFSNEWIELNEVYIKIGWNNWLKMIFSFFLYRHKWCLENRMVYFFDFFLQKDEIEWIDELNKKNDYFFFTYIHGWLLRSMIFRFYRLVRLHFLFLRPWSFQI